jgi:hypothetical protein
VADTAQGRRFARRRERERDVLLSWHNARRAPVSGNEGNRPFWADLPTSCGVGGLSGLLGLHLSPPPPFPSYGSPRRLRCAGVATPQLVRIPSCRRNGRHARIAIITTTFLIAGGLYWVTALREHDQERVTVYTKHRLPLQAQMTEALGLRHPKKGRWPGRRGCLACWWERDSDEGCAPPPATVRRQPEPQLGR